MLSWQQKKDQLVSQGRNSLQTYLHQQHQLTPLPFDTQFLRVFTGSRWLPWPNEQRPHAGFRSLAPNQFDQTTQSWLQSQVSNEESLNATIDHLTELLLPAQREQSVPRALFVEQIYGATRTLSGQRDRRTVLHVLRDTLIYRLFNKDISFVLRNYRKENGSLAHLTQKSLTYADQASIWDPNDITEIYRRTFEFLGDSSEKINVGALSGSWASPVIAALNDASIAARIESFLVVDVLQEYNNVVNNHLQPYAPFRIDLHLDGGSEGPTLVAPPQRRHRYDLLLWNPPYWALEQYDMRDAALLNDNASGMPQERIAQPPVQSTADRNESFDDWLQRFVCESAANAARLLVADRGLLVLVVPSAVRFQGSFARSPAWFNIDGMCRGASQQWSLDDFAARFLSAAQQGARGVGCVWREVERQEKRFSRSDNHFELTITLQCCTLSDEQGEKKRELSLIDCDNDDDGEEKKRRKTNL